MVYETISLQQDATGIAVLTMVRPEAMNALSDRMLVELADVTKQIAATPSIKVLILTGAGKAFCAGGDISRFAKGFDAQSAYDYMNGIHQWMREFTELAIPTIAAVNGYATGAGLCLSLFCDIIFAGERASFGSAFLNVGIVPDLAALYYLPRLMGLQRAKEFVFTGEMLDAKQAYNWGLVNHVVPDNELLLECHKMAGRLAKTSHFALMNAKRLMNAGMDASRDEVLDMEVYAQSLCFMGRDFAEGIRSFHEKRKPEFQW